MSKNEKKVTVMGLGLNGGGVGVAMHFLRRGYSVTVTDLQSPKNLQASIDILENEFGKQNPNLNFVFGQQHQEKDFIDTSLVVKNSAIKWSNQFVKLAQQNQVPVTTELQIFGDEVQKMIQADKEIVLIGVTGTRGKSTTVSLIYEFLKLAYSKVFLVGNIGKSCLEILPQLEREGGLVVMELSSFQLDGLTFSPHIAVVNNLFEDHLDYHGDWTQYVEAKKNILRYQTANDIAVLNYDNPSVRQFADTTKGRVEYFSYLESNFYAKVYEAKLSWGSVCEMPLADIALQGKHNVSNILGALTAVKSFETISCQRVQEVLKNFKGLFGRQEILGPKKDLIWVNDTTSTMPKSLCTALDTFCDQSLHLIAGGNDKNLNYDEVYNHITSNLKSVFLLPGTATEKLKLVLFRRKILDKDLVIEEVDNLKEAVDKVLRIAQKKDWVLFSPGATSFGQFANEFERGKVFEKIIKSL